jgi:hypothetical protein
LRITTTEGAIAAARDFGATTGPLAALASGEVPACFGRLGLELVRLLRQGRTTEAELHTPDGPDDDLFELGKTEMAEINGAITDLNAWTAGQRCAAATCECRADRFLRRLLRERHFPEEPGFSPQLGRMACLVAGYAFESRYALVHYRSHITHPVRLHGGWQARLRTSDGESVLYQSPGYPNAALDLYYDDTRACADAVTAALGRQRSD